MKNLKYKNKHNHKKEKKNEEILILLKKKMFMLLVNIKQINIKNYLLKFRILRSINIFAENLFKIKI